MIMRDLELACLDKQKLYHWTLLSFCFSKHPRTPQYLVWSWNAVMLKFRKILYFPENTRFSKIPDFSKIQGFWFEIRDFPWNSSFFLKIQDFFEISTCSHFTTRQDTEEFLGVLKSRKRVESSDLSFVCPNMLIPNLSLLMKLTINIGWFMDRLTMKMFAKMEIWIFRMEKMWIFKSSK